LNVGYKIFAAILLNRLRDGGAEDRIWSTQFGFRRRHGTEHALLIARRRIEQAWASKDGSLMMIALDWAKAFDSIDPQGLLKALCRFGVPERFTKVVAAIYTERRFRVRDCGSTSNLCAQSFGICQGCPLSPFLFSMVMTCLMKDAKDVVVQQLGQPASERLSELLYADDTLLMGTSSQSLSAFLQAVADIGVGFGMSQHVGKTKLLNVRTNATVLAPGDVDLKGESSMTYLGGLLSSDGRSVDELSRRLGLAAADFKTLSKIWSHANVSMRRKVQVFEACVVSVLMYGLKTIWLGAAGRRRLDGFQARCIRKILKIPASFISRVSNASVRRQAGVMPLSSELLKQQLRLFGSIAARPCDALRDSIFAPGTIELAEAQGNRCQGRPRHTWADQVRKRAVNVAGSEIRLEEILAQSDDMKAWNALVSEHTAAASD
jgi:hypothetical protein